MIECIEVGGRCKSALYLRKHKCVKMNGLGWRCKYCGTPLIILGELERRKAKCRHY